ncbi:MAG: sigma 54-dependent Fis family transcriptional regulator [Myxococcales bacterium]|nr:sigma 54-dependent Fis family transcriptional regulator [Myxococcales bacterium]
MFYRNEPLRDFPLSRRALEVGRDRSCDIVVHDASVPDRAWVVAPAGGTVACYRPGPRPRPRHLPYDRPLVLGQHSLVRVRDGGDPYPSLTDPVTDRVAPIQANGGVPVVSVGVGADARRIRLDDLPVHVGSSPDNGLVLSDRTVSRSHCRLLAVEGGVAVRDLGSRNGTWINGVRVECGRVSIGGKIRVGRTDLWILENDPIREDLVVASSAMKGLVVEATRYARLSWPVLIEGPSGAGKEGIARLLHRESSRADRPFVAVNAGAMAPDLVASELFGHTKGAFTGAASSHRGVFEQAHGGVLFLDEVGELPLPAQAQLLRVLETWEVRPVGSEAAIAVDVRLLCATHRDLRAMVRRGAFREDLYFRMARLTLGVAPLAQRVEDIAPLAQHFLDGVASEVGPRTLSDGGLSALLSYHWPGNVRELRNVVCAAAVASAGEVLEAMDVERALAASGAERPVDRTPEQMTAIVAQYGGNLSAAARALGVPRTTLRDRFRRQRA